MYHKAAPVFDVVIIGRKGRIPHAHGGQRLPAGFADRAFAFPVFDRQNAAGAGLVNDVFALRQDGALETAAGLGVPVCLMHMQGRPRDMQSDPRYADVVTEVEAFLVERALACEAAGISRARILIDPGFGFGKSLQHNIDLFRALPRLCGGDYPVLVGVSRKSMLGALTGKPVEDRLAASVAAAVLAARHGAAVVRVHDVAETVDALKVLQVLETAVHPSR